VEVRIPRFAAADITMSLWDVGEGSWKR